LTSSRSQLRVYLGMRILKHALKHALLEHSPQYQHSAFVSRRAQTSPRRSLDLPPRVLILLDGVAPFICARWIRGCCTRRECHITHLAAFPAALDRGRAPFSCRWGSLRQCSTNWQSAAALRRPSRVYLPPRSFWPPILMGWSGGRPGNMQTWPSKRASATQQAACHLRACCLMHMSSMSTTVRQHTCTAQARSAWWRCESSAWEGRSSSWWVLVYVPHQHRTSRPKTCTWRRACRSSLSLCS